MLNEQASSEPQNGSSNEIKRDLPDQNNSNQAENKKGPNQEHIRRTFEVWRESLGNTITKEDETRMLGIQEAAISRDTEKAKKHLLETMEESNWLYQELMQHPEISTILRELSIMGF